MFIVNTFASFRQGRDALRVNPFGTLKHRLLRGSLKFETQRKVVHLLQKLLAKPPASLIIHALPQGNG